MNSLVVNCRHKLANKTQPGKNSHFSDTQFLQPIFKSTIFNILPIFHAKTPPEHNWKQGQTNKAQKKKKPIVKSATRLLMASCQPAVPSCHWRSRWPRSPITHPPHSCKPPHVRTFTPGHCSLRHAAGARLLIPPSMLGWKCSPWKWLNSGPRTKLSKRVFCRDSRAPVRAGRS